MALWFFILKQVRFLKGDFRSKAKSGKQKQTKRFRVMIQWAEKKLVRIEATACTAIYDPYLTILKCTYGSKFCVVV